MGLLAAPPPPFTAERAPESPTGSDEASGCAVDLQQLEQRRTSSQLHQSKVLHGFDIPKTTGRKLGAQVDPQYMFPQCASAGYPSIS